MDLAQEINILIAKRKKERQNHEKNLHFSCISCKLYVDEILPEKDAVLKEKELNRQHMAHKRSKWNRRIEKLAGIPAYILEFIIDIFNGR